MKLSQFTVVLNDYPKTGHHLLYHTLSRALIEVDKAGWDVLQTLSTDTPTDAQCLAFLRELETQGFIVEKSMYWVQKHEFASHFRCSRSCILFNPKGPPNLHKCPKSIPSSNSSPIKSNIPTPAMKRLPRGLECPLDMSCGAEKRSTFSNTS